MKNKGFTRKMFADGETDTVSHKRVVSISSLVMLIILSFLSAFGYNAVTECFYMFAILTGGESFLTTIEKTSKIVRNTRNSVNKINEDEDDSSNEEMIDE